jgi:hypothetical protein
MPHTKSKVLYCKNSGHWLAVSNGKTVQTDTPILYPVSKTISEVAKELNVTFSENVLLTEIQLATIVDYPNE